MVLKNINASVSAETETQACQYIKDLEALFPFLTELLSDDRVRIAKLSRRYVDFVERCLFHAKANPQFVPPYLSSEEFASDVELKSVLHRVNAEINVLSRKIKDTILAVEAEAYAAARTFYKSVKTAAQQGTAGAQEVNLDLVYNFRKRRTAKPAPVDNNQEKEKPA